MKDQNVFELWDGSNPCYTCKGACCENVRVEVSTISYIPLAEIFGSLLPYVVNINDQPYDVGKCPSEAGVYWTVNSKGRQFVDIIGQCPELMEDGSCGARNRGASRPWGCNTSGLDSIKCTTNRRFE